jgi:signal transduction histidine kinase
MSRTRAVATLGRVTRRPRGESLDRIVAAVLIVAAEIELWVGSATPGLPKGLGAALAIIVGGSVALRRRHPLAVGITVMLAINLIFLVGANNYSVPLTLGWMCALYALAVWTDTRGFLIGLAVLAGSDLVAAAGPSTEVGDAVFFAVVPSVAMVIARRAVRERQLLAETLAARAEVLERDHEARANQAVAEERARIARELHDLVAHNVSVMVVQAGVERHALPPEQASTREALTSIEQAGRQALTEARRLLGMLRRGDQHEELEPQPSLDRLDLLVEQIQRAGLPVTVSIEGEGAQLPAGLDLCAYRIVQEGLTNALKHAGAARVDVLVRYEPHALVIEVRDDGRGAAHVNGDGAGQGLIGMRERVALYDGELEAGPYETGGFRVRAQLPLA